LISAAHAIDFKVRDYAGSPTADGLTWATAFSRIDQAIAAIPSSGSHRILIAKAQSGHAWKPGGGTHGAWGTWNTQQWGALPPRDSTFLISAEPTNLTILGGFPESPSESGDDRCVFAHATVLSGDLDGNDSALAGFELDTSNDLNAYHVVTFKDISDRVVLDGITVERGNADDGRSQVPDGVAQGQGGAGIFLTATPTLVAPNTLRYLTFATPIIQNCTIQLNSGLTGGGIAGGRHEPEDPEPIPSLAIRTSTIRGNYATNYGAGIAIGKGELILEGSLVVANRSASYGGGAYLSADYGNEEPGNGGTCRAYFRNCTIAENESSTRLAGIAWDNLLESSEIILASCILCRNAEVDSSDGFAWLSWEDISTQIGKVDTSGGALENATITDSVRPSFPVIFCPYGNGPNDPWQPLYRDARDVYFVSAGPAMSPLLRDYHVHCCSSSRDAGALTGLPLDVSDVDGDLNTTELLPDRQWGDRVLSSGYASTGPRVDAGAFEHAAGTCRFDVDFDGFVGAADLAILLGMWRSPTTWSAPECDDLGANFEDICVTSVTGDPPPCLCLDVDRDDYIEAPELAGLLGAWGACACNQIAPQCGASEGLAFSEAESSSSTTSLVGLPASPLAIAELFGFDSLASFATWLATLSVTDRAAVLSLVSDSGGAA
jgi:hypothetical protein